MGCAASTTASVPAQQPPAGQQMPIEVMQQQQQPNARPVAVNQLQRPGGNPGQPTPAASSEGNLKSAPVIKSLVDLKREEGCTIENGQEGCFVRLKFSSLTAGEVIAYFDVKETTVDEKTMPELEATQVSQQRFSPGSGQSARLLLCKDQLLAGAFVEAKDKHQLVIELKADSSDPKAISLQRSYLKLNSENTSAQVTAQKVKLGNAVRSLQALYGTLPNPKTAIGSTAPDASGDAEGGECVICLSKPREVAILRCRHVCLCRSCATITSSTWSFQCPVCRGRVAAMIGIEAG